MLGRRLWRSYVPDFVEVNGKSDPEAEDVVLVLRLAEEPDDPIGDLPRPERRRARAARAQALWDAHYERARSLPGQKTSPDRGR